MHPHVEWISPLEAAGDVSLLYLSLSFSLCLSLSQAATGTLSNVAPSVVREAVIIAMNC